MRVTVSCVLMSVTRSEKEEVLGFITVNLVLSGRSEVALCLIH